MIRKALTFLVDVSPIIVVMLIIGWVAYCSRD